MEYEKLVNLIDAVSRSELSSFAYEGGGVRLHLSKGQNQGAVPAGEAEAACGKVSHGEVAVESWVQKKESGDLVKSPLVGTFYAAPSQDGEPYVKAGDTVHKGQVLAIIEAMKLMNEIESEYDGQVTEILVENGSVVEYGQPLFRICKEAV